MFTPVRVSPTLLVRAAAVAVVLVAGFVTSVHADEDDLDASCGAQRPAGEPDANPYADNELWANAEDGVYYGAPGGATPRREVSVSSTGDAGVTASDDLVGGASAGADADGPCAELAPADGAPEPNEDEAACGKPYGGPLTLRPNNAEQPDFAWNDEYLERPVTMTSARTCATLSGVMHAPADVAERGTLPAVLLLPPSGGVATVENMGYLAKALAGAGYITLTVEPQGTGGSDVVAWPPCGTEPGYSNPSPCAGQPFQRMDNWMEAARTGLDHLLGDDNPWADHVDVNRVGATGHSLGARAASYLQDPALDLGDPQAEPRIHAVVGLDNLSADYYGDRSASSHSGRLNDGNDLGLTNRVVNGQPFGGSEPITITVPGLGLGSDDDDSSPDDKKAAAIAHRDGGQASGMLIFDGAAHGDFSQRANSEEALLFQIAHYTVAWFDLWLSDPASTDDRADALDRLLTRSIAGTPIEEILSDTERSAFYGLDDLDDCEDWRSGCPRTDCAHPSSASAAATGECRPHRHWCPDGSGAPGCRPEVPSSSGGG